MITEWEQMVGKTVEAVEQFFLGGYLLVFKDGDCAHIDGSGEELHGAHWPILCEDDLDLVAGAVKSIKHRLEATNG